MKKTISKLIALLMVAMMLVAALPFASLAEAPATDVNVSVEFDHIDDWSYDFFFTITIPDGYNASSITLDDFMDMIMDEEMMWVYDRESGIKEVLHDMPTYEFIYHFKLIDNSGNGYVYKDQSVSYTFAEPHFPVNRILNQFWKSLGFTDGTQLSNTNIAEKLRTLDSDGKYGTASDSDDDVVNKYLDKYFVDWYNANHQTATVTSIEEIPASFFHTLMNTSNNEGIVETNEAINENLGIRYFREYCYFVDAENVHNPVGSTLAEIEDKTTSAYTAFNEKFSNAINENTGKDEDGFFSFNRIMAGYTTNQFANWDYTTKLSFTLVKSGSEKIDLPGSEKWIVVNGEEVAHDNIAAGEDVNFILKSNIGEDFTTVFPEDYPVAGEDPNAYGYTRDDFGQYTFKFVDKYDPAFIIPTDAGDYVVKVNGTQLTTDQYTLTMVTAEDGTLTFEIAINDLVQLFLDGVFNYEDIGVAPITVEYTAQTGEDLTAGNYVNESWVEYNGTPTEHSTVDVSTYKISVFKYDQATDEPLAGATFALYDVNPSEEGNENVEPIATGVTGEDGYVIFDGLDVGTYYLVETEAPNGYVCDSSVHEVNIVADETTGYAENQEVEFPNVSVPHTGGEGTRMFYTVGGAILACAAAAYVVSRKKAGSLA